MKDWVKIIGEDPSRYGTHSLRRTKVTIMYRQTHNLRAAQILLGHTKIENTVKYLGVELDEALACRSRLRSDFMSLLGNPVISGFPSFAFLDSK